jgi:hypothetical protein
MAWAQKREVSSLVAGRRPRSSGLGGLMSDDEGTASAGEDGADAAEEGPAAKRLWPAAAGFRFRESLGFSKDPEHQRWAVAEDEDGDEPGEGEGDGDEAEERVVDDPENPGNLGPIQRGYGDREEVAAVEGSPFLTPTVPLQLRRAVFANDMGTIRALVNRWTSARTSGGMADTVAGKFATAVWDETSQDTMLHVAVRKGYPEMARYLVSQGARIHTRNRRRQTPLGLARATVERLLGWHARPLAIRLSGHPDPKVDGLYTQCAHRRVCPNHQWF